MIESVGAPTLDELRALLDDFELEQKRLLVSLRKRNKKINHLITKQTEDESAARGVVSKKCEIQDKIFVRTTLSPEFVTARDILTAKLLLAKSGRNPAAEQRTLLAEIESFQSQFQRLCRHQFVFAYDGLVSYSMCTPDIAGHRVCTLCNLRETSKGAPDDVYDVLVNDGTRMIRRDLRERPPGLHVEEWFTVEFLQQLFDASAGERNVRWPKLSYVLRA